MGLISNATTIFDAGSISAGIGGSLVFIKKLTASSSGTLSFVHGSSDVVFDSTYKEYLFTFKDIHPGTNAGRLTFQVDSSGNTNYNKNITSTSFKAYHQEDGNPAALEYNGSYDQAQGTGFQNLSTDIISDNDASCNGYLHIFNPGLATFLKHFVASVNGMTDGSPPYSEIRYTAGYVSETSAALDKIQFKMDSGNIDAGDICLYGIK